MKKDELCILLERYGRTLSAFCYSVCKDVHTADEIFQEVCLRLLKTNISANDERAVTSYLYKTALSVYRDIQRKIRRRGEVSIEETEVRRYVDSIADSEEDRGGYEALYRAVKSLPDKYREVVQTVYFRELDESAAARILGIPKGTVKSRLHKAKELLKKELENENN
ncbi:MAG: RNA polymerase sigma factor [Clostridia bacterium]|nr:RNA polymerase sigma factor [Clostridia bacterium]